MSIKDTLADLGIDTCVEFCELNEIPQPTLHISRNLADPESRRIKMFATCGYYRNNHIYVSVPLCAHANAMYSWPAFISDRTPYGVIQHELGHHVDQVKTGYDVYKRHQAPTYSDKVRAYSQEPAITSYSPNTMEWFAEIFRLFVTNPVLLSMIRPRAYDFLARDFTPVGELDAAETLKQFNAPERVFQRMDNWIKKGK